MRKIKQDLDLFQLIKSKLIIPHIRKMHLLYRASENNFLASKFHETCYGHGDTITIIKNNFGNIFGGYTNIPWSSDGKWHSNNEKSFLFLLYSHNDKIECPRVYFKILHQKIPSQSPYNLLIIIQYHYDLNITLIH